MITRDPKIITSWHKLGLEIEVRDDPSENWYLATNGLINYRIIEDKIDTGQSTILEYRLRPSKD